MAQNKNWIECIPLRAGNSQNMSNNRDMAAEDGNHSVEKADR